MIGSNIWFRMTLTLCSIMINITSLSFCVKFLQFFLKNKNFLILYKKKVIFKLKRCFPYRYITNLFSYIRYGN